MTALSDRDMFKICLIGCGIMANNSHGPAIKMYTKQNEGIQFAACCDIDEARAKSFAQKFDVPAWYTSIPAMLDEIKPQAVCLIAPVPITAELSCEIMEKGYPLILEKPPGAHSKETRHMIQIANAKNIPNQVAFNRRYMPIVQKTVDILTQWGGVGCIYDLQYKMVRQNRTDPHFCTTAIHGIDLVKYILQADYSHINFRYRELPDKGSTVANFHLNCTMDNGVLANLAFLPISGINTERLEINTAHGLLCVNLPIWTGCYDGFGTIALYNDNEKKWELDGADIAGTSDDFVLAGFYHENAVFFDAVRSGTKINGDVASGLQSVEIAECISKRTNEYIRGASHAKS